MKLLGILLLVIGAALAAYAMNMDVSVTVAARDFGFGIQTPELNVVNAELMARRQNFLLIGGVLAVIGAIFTGIGVLSQSKVKITTVDEDETASMVTGSDDRVEFHNGVFTVGQKVFKTFEEAELFRTESLNKKSAAL